MNFTNPEHTKTQGSRGYSFSEALERNKHFILNSWFERIQVEISSLRWRRPALHERAPELLDRVLRLLNNTSHTNNISAISATLPQINFDLYSINEVHDECRLLRQQVVGFLERQNLLSSRNRDIIWDFFDRESLHLHNASLEYLVHNKLSEQKSELAQDTSQISDPANRLRRITGTISVNGLIGDERIRLLKSADDVSLIAEVSRILFHSMDYELTLEQFAQAIVKTFCSWCIVDVIDEDGAFKRLAVIHRSPDKEHLASELKRDFPPHAAARGVPSEVLRTTKALLTPVVTDEHYAATIRSPRHEALLRGLDSRSYICAPLLARGNFLGAITFVNSEGEKTYDEDDLLLAQELCFRAAQAVDNALLYRKAQKAIQLREDMVSIVSHDLKNPLTAIDMSASLLSRLLPSDQRFERVQKPIETIRRSARRMQNLVADLLDLSRIQSGHIKIDLKLEPVESLISEVMDIYEPMALTNSIKLRAEFSEDLFVTCDRERFLQITSNLIGNALKFTAEGGEVVIRAEKRETGAAFSVEDTGPGISKDDIPNLFERFWQSATTARKGTGLGLSIVKAMVEAHGGQVWAESELGKGSTFWFFLPEKTHS